MKITVILHIIILFAINLEAEDFRQHIVYLTSDSLAGRYPATRGEELAAKYIYSELSNANCKIVIQKFPFENGLATNVIGSIDNHCDSTIFISAHYDHIGTGNGKSMELSKKGIHRGADDNASGVAMMLELAKVLGSKNNSKYNYAFAAWSAHETGLHGSEFFTNSQEFDSFKIATVLNLDMIGRLNINNPIIRISGALTNSKMRNLFDKTKMNNLSYRFDDDNILKSDLKHFALRGIPVLNFTTGLHSDYHKLNDIEEKINYDGMNTIFLLLIRIIGEL